MPIVASRGIEIRRLIADLKDPVKRPTASMRLKTLGARVVPHVDDELGRFDRETRTALASALASVDTADARALRKRLERVESKSPSNRDEPRPDGAEASALGALRALPPPRPNERASISRDRGEAHLTLARAGSRLARRDLLHCLLTLPPHRSDLYFESAGLVGDADFIEPLARIGMVRKEARVALTALITRERITRRSKVLRSLEAPLRDLVMTALHASRPAGRR